MRIPLDLHYSNVPIWHRIQLIELEVARLKYLKYLLWIVLPANVNQALLVRCSVTSEDVLVLVSIVLIYVFVIRVHGLGQSYRGVDYTIASSNYPVVVLWRGPHNGDIQYYCPSSATFALGDMSYEEAGLHIRGPSDSVMPKAFPPFLEKYEITSLVIGCSTSAGIIPSASVTLSISVTKSSRI